jgi:hypothetical protein
MLWGLDSSGTHMGTTVCQLASQSAPYEHSCAESEYYFYLLFSVVFALFLHCIWVTLQLNLSLTEVPLLFL